jgi:hypothetical protein
MAQLSRSKATLRVIGDELSPDEITKLLGCSPSYSHFKGEVVKSKNTKHEYIKKFGMWRLEATACEPENLDAQVAELLTKLTQDLAVWSRLKDRFEIDLFCGFFMETTNEGAEISSATLKALGERGIVLDLDIYAPTELDERDPCPCKSGKTYGDCCLMKTIKV